MLGHRGPPLAERAARLVADHQLESQVLLDVANHYANEVHGVLSPTEGRVLVQALARGYALRVAEEDAGSTPPVTPALARAVDEERGRWPGALGTVIAAVDGVAGLPSGAVSGPGRRLDDEHAFGYGYLVRSAEMALADDPQPAVAASLDDLLARTDALLGTGDDLFGGEESRVALVLGVLHGLELDDAPSAAREIAVAAARAGFALRRAEEERGLAGACPRLAAWLRRMAQERADVPMWDAAQMAAWEAVDDAPGRERRCPSLTKLPGHPERGAAFAQLADAAARDVGALLTGLAPADAVRAARFGYALRAAEWSTREPPRS